MTEDERAKAFKMLEAFEQELPEVIKAMGSSREFSIAATKLDEVAMWLRRGIERA